MTVEEAKEFAKNMSYRNAVCNAMSGKCVPFRKATAIKLKELLSFAESLDKMRADIESMDYLSLEDGSDGYDNYIDRYDVLQIIDKYMGKSEEKK